jgi:hypothetical protein
LHRNFTETKKNKKMKNFKLSRKLMMGAAVACALSVSLSSCEEDDTVDPPTGGGGGDATAVPTRLIGLDISANTTWSKDTVYVLTSRIKVRPPATLSIQAGTIIKGSEGQGSNAKVLMVMRGAKIMAEGTASEPIIFTSIKDNIQPGQVQSPNLPNDLVGQWGGLAILGNATIATKTRTGSFDEAQIEGVPTTDTDGVYGGNNDADNSGILRYVSVRHGGTQLASGNELNGISFGGVGSGTVLENIEIVANADDGLEFYGGTVNATNVLIWNNGDDGLDTDNGYRGTIDNFLLVGAAGSPMELDGPEGSTTTITSNHTLRNGTVVTSRPDGTSSEDLLNYDANTNVTVENVNWKGVKAGQIINDNNVLNNVLSVTNLRVDVPAGSSLSSFISATDPSINSAITAGTTNGANTSAFAGWTWAEASGALTGL